MLSFFEYNGKRSDEMNLTISPETAETSPGHDIEFIEVMGKDGELAIDNERLKAFPYPIHTNFRPKDKNIDAAASDISRWLKTDVRYKPLLLSWQPNYVYIAIFYEQFDIKETLPKFGKLPLNFRCQPYKYRKDGQESISLTNGQTLTNKEKRVAKPLIKVTGTGNVTLKNNGVDWAILSSVDEHITIDSKSMSVYKDKLFQFTKMNANLSPLFPVLSPGNNTITWTGSVESVEIIPRWEAVV